MAVERSVDAVTFDYWNTLVFEQPGHLTDRRIRAWLGILEEAGLVVDEPRIRGAFEGSWKRATEHWKSNRGYYAPHAVSEILEELAIELTQDLRDRLGGAFWGAAEGAELHLTDGVESCLRSLRDAGLRLGIVCDVGMTPSSYLRAFLESNGLLEWFDHWAFSDEVGHYKPSPTIFRNALDGLGVKPERAAHVGDLRRTDVAGALAAGMTAVRYTGIVDDQSQPEPEAHHVVGHHRDLPGVIGMVGRAGL
jgi:FMN phosphatase YigB (HAD superfamily)